MAAIVQPVAQLGCEAGVEEEDGDGDEWLPAGDMALSRSSGFLGKQGMVGF